MSPVSAGEQARRPSRPRWFDPRLAVGIALVVTSVAGVVMLVGAADRTDTAYAAGSALAIGDVLTVDDLVETEVRLGVATEHYLTPARMPDGEIVVTRTISAGELVPASAVGQARSTDWASLVVSVSGDLPRSVGAGTTVDIWATGDESETPGIVASEATVVAISSEESMVAGAAVSSVELVVPRDRVARLLQAKAAGDFLSLVPAAIPLER
ncbi:hypothetical protein FVA74_04315 [Salinibacterium sp. dk2585]|uniref:hypothetical protein n=1 Tax=unclassified Salinibacterium TaxID=2632331 RepID=UPI0011C24501|nr:MULTISPECIES: hypothetical protein [unclassified Salinibacterium]QEE60890.1 hypothetical protein FVA74_04315 [Salinibacterium sp. dk2585]TXK55961.1 hypothetical protein FVP63_04460 [Salinibacterium sp. dk5596]